MGCVLAIDAGTSGVRTLAFDEAGTLTDQATRPLTPHFPRPGWVEHDPVEIWDLVRASLAEVAGRLSERGTPIAAVGLANQRETVVAWDRRTGRPLHDAIVWQDRRTAARCEELAAEGQLEPVRERTGLVLDPYFSATKFEWLLTHGGVAAGADLALGTVPVPGLREVHQLATMDPDSDAFRYLKTKLVRQRNRIEHALRAASRMVKEFES